MCADCSEEESEYNLHNNLHNFLENNNLAKLKLTSDFNPHDRKFISQ